MLALRKGLFSGAKILEISSHKSGTLQQTTGD